jgi:hypothetical protein
MSSQVTDAVTPALLREIRDFWFEPFPDDDSLVVPDRELTKRWFFGGKEFDDICV